MNQPQCTTQIELVEHWLVVHKFCKGTNVKPEDCWKINRGRGYGIPTLLNSPQDYEFAIGLCEGRPVWRDSVLYWPDGSDFHLSRCSKPPILHPNLSWTHAKKTITINGMGCAKTDRGD